MPIRTILGSEINYYLVCYDKSGNERNDDPDKPGGILSDLLRNKVANSEYTDVFFSSHGWKGDVPSAISQYDNWFGSMLNCKEDIARLKSRPQGFKPLIIGLHWPSLPFGMESHDSKHALSDDDEESIFVEYGATGNSKKSIYEQASDSIADTEEARAAIKEIIDSAADESTPDEVPADVVSAFEILIKESGLQTGSESSPPGEDIPEFDVKAIYELLLEDEGQETLADFGSGDGRGPIVKLLTQLSIWKMKERARTFGENGAAKLLRQLLELTSNNVQFHLMGHSLGSIVISSTITGKNASTPLPRPVNSLFLVQGALSLWAYCKDMPVSPGKSGYFHTLSTTSYLSGPILVSYTENDTAVAKLFPLAARATFWKGVDFDPSELPKYGGIGAFGVRGNGIQITDLELLPKTGTYNYKPNVFYNIDTSEYMKSLPGLSGAHNDIAHPEMAHAFWSAIR